MATRQLTRSRTNRVLAGVAGGIADYTGMDPGLTRLITAAVVIFTGVGPLAYLLAWIVLPVEGSSTTGLDSIIATFKKGTVRHDSNPNPTDYR